MAAKQEEATTAIGIGAKAGGNSDPGGTSIDVRAPAGSGSSLGAESVRDGRPATGDEVVEAMDEEGPGVTAPLATEKAK
jgi:hypothetical protein